MRGRVHVRAMMNLLGKFNRVASEKRVHQPTREQTEDEGLTTWRELSRESHETANNTEKRGTMTEAYQYMYYESACLAKRIVCLKCGDMKRSCGCQNQVVWDFRSDKTAQPVDSDAETEIPESLQ